MRYRLQRHDGTDCSATMVPITVLRMVPIQRYRHISGNTAEISANLRILSPVIVKDLKIIYFDINDYIIRKNLQEILLRHTSVHS